LKTRLYGNEGCKYIDVSQEDLRIFINLVDRKEKDIEGWKKYCEEIEEEQTEMSNKNCELEFEIEKLQKENEKALAEYMEWQKQELEQKDKIIEQMTYYIMNLDIDEDICKKVNCDTNSGELDCKDCIKQYFENKAKEIR
jgi:hypothetical protein